ncbi:winged helix-turn-helix domain-containing protein [Halopenitus malekzadehii]|nr:winged helix-turn-helix domain-containing protein [Halopenitus malekzadehii]
MTSADNRILEFLDEKGIVATPYVIAANIDYNRLYVNERIRILAQNELVEKGDEPLYQITERGRQYLQGELGVDDLPAMHEEDR